MRTVDVRLPAAPYRITIDPGTLAQGSALRPLLRGPSALLVTDSVVGPAYAGGVQRQLEGLSQATVILPTGERHKTLESAQRVWDALAAAGFGRDTTVVALGGGVVGDVAGFAAATWQRGVDLVQVPTSLLAMVDSGVGGKCAINHAAGKNLIGAFHQPRAVLVDPACLATLDARQLRAGLAEVIKVALAFDAAFLASLERDLDRILAQDAAALEQAIGRSLELKAEVVVADEREQGRRALLNLGHTFGHAIESAQGYAGLLHGEAVAVGLACAARASQALGALDAAALARILALLARAGLPTALPVGLGRAALEPRFARDKKARDGRPRFVVLRGIGRAELIDALPEPALAAAFAA
jgi:3-dehydroquinate synthase